MKVVIDTNVLWVSISRRSATHWIFQAILDGSITLCVTTDILEEYAEIISQKLGNQVSEAILNVFENLPNVNFITRYYRWQIIKQDPDDDKFVDCAIASNSIGIITQDNHFKVLKKLPFPKVSVYSIEEFETIFTKLKNSNI